MSVIVTVTYKEGSGAISVQQVSVYNRELISGTELAKVNDSIDIEVLEDVDIVVEAALGEEEWP